MDWYFIVLLYLTEIGDDCSVCGWNDTVDCSNGAYSQSGCGCSCADYWGKDSGGYSYFFLLIVFHRKCTTCNTKLYRDTFCNGRGSVASDPVTNYCASCTCPPEWSGNDCSVCTRNDSYCNGYGSINSNCNCTCLSNVLGSRVSNLNYDLQHSHSVRTVHGTVLEEEL